MNSESLMAVLLLASTLGTRTVSNTIGQSEL
jgi:hypothetical protein